MDAATDITILIDSREQRPLFFPGYKVERVCLKSGDYSLVADQVDLRDRVAVERKSISDLLGCIGGQRERFERELERMAPIPFRALVIEGGIPDLVEAAKGTKLHPRAVMGSVLAWAFKFGANFLLGATIRRRRGTHIADSRSARSTQNLSLIWFTVWSSVVHGGIMAIQAFVYPEHGGHLLGDSPGAAGARGADPARRTGAQRRRAPGQVIAFSGPVNTPDTAAGRRHHPGK
jgi:DNA excision repair protein ERCC-4